MYVPLWNDEKKALSIAPDDGAKWSPESGFTFKLSTAGYNNIRFSMKGYTNNQGPRSISLEYSLNGKDWESVVQYQDLRASGSLYQVFNRYLLPTECDNQTALYIRIITDEDETYLREKLHYNVRKATFILIMFSSAVMKTMKLRCLTRIKLHHSSATRELLNTTVLTITRCSTL